MGRQLQVIFIGIGICMALHGDVMIIVIWNLGNTVNNAPAGFK